LGGNKVFAPRFKAAFAVLESSLVEISVARAIGAELFPPAESESACDGGEVAARHRRESWTPLLIGRDFSGLTLTADKPWALNSSVNRAFVMFVVFFTSN
jgi:hypothetical protein